MAEHTPTLDTYTQAALERIYAWANEQGIRMEIYQDRCEAVRRIARAVNSHAALVAQLKALCVQLEACGMVVPPGVKAALSLAEGKP